MSHFETAHSSVMKIDNRFIGLQYPTYFIADIAANHNGDLGQAKHLIELAKEAGAEAAKFQHFTAEKIVSARGFEVMGNISHQAKWKKSVVEVYREASVPKSWTPVLKRHAEQVGIHFFSAPYDFEAIDALDAYMPAYKIGSGDITWLEALERIAVKQKPTFLATGASTMEEVEEAVEVFTRINPQLCIMQCNTNYTGNFENFKYINLNVLKTFALKFPNLLLGLSDHTPGLSTVMGAVTLGARVVEKHFTDNKRQEGPDHGFSIEPSEWREMVDRVRELEAALGADIKKVEANEAETVFIQRRCCRAAREIKAGEIFKKDDIDVLRPVQPGAYLPKQIVEIVGRKARRNLPKGEALTPADFA